MVTRCPACNSTKIFEDKDNLICRNCNFINKSNKRIEEENENGKK